MTVYVQRESRRGVAKIAQAGLEITERQVTNIVSSRRGFMLQGGDEIYDAKTVLLCTGEERVSGVVLTDGTEIVLNGVFVLRSAVAPGTLLKGLEIDGADIVVDRHMATNKPGCYAAGDCTGRPYQLAKALCEALEDITADNAICVVAGQAQMDGCGDRLTIRLSV